MKTDPNLACANSEERLLWALLHDAVAHPLMALFLYAKWTLRFHDFTSHKAWPRGPQISYWKHGMWKCEAEGLISFAKSPEESVERWKAFKAAMGRV